MVRQSYIHCCRIFAQIRLFSTSFSVGRFATPTEILGENNEITSSGKYGKFLRKRSGPMYTHTPSPSLSLFLRKKLNKGSSISETCKELFHHFFSSFDKIWTYNIKAEVTYSFFSLENLDFMQKVEANSAWPLAT